MMALANAQVAQLYVALFGRAPDAEGLAFWSGLLESGEKSVAQVADMMFATTPARAYFPEGASDGQVIASFYLNVLGRTADIVGLSYWTLKLGVPGATRGSVLAEMVSVVTHYTGTDPAGLTSAQLFANKSAAAIFFGENGGSAANATQVLAGITTDANTITPARTLHVDNASGTVDLGGFTDITIGELAGDVVLTHVVDGAHIRFADTSHKIEIDSLDPAWEDSALSITLPDGPLFENSTAHQPVYSDITLGGFNELTVLSDNDSAEILYLRGADLDELTITGSGYIDVMDPTNAGNFGASVDATGFAGTVETHLSEGATLRGSTGADKLWGWSEGGATIDGGLGNDLIGGTAVTMIGGSGKDQFTPAWYSGTSHVTIADFTKGSDSINLYQLATNHAPPVNGVITSYGKWYAAKVSLADGATFDAYLDAAAAPRMPSATYAAINWFQWGGDTYIVVDNNPSESTFHEDSDFVVKLVGAIDLTTAIFSAKAAVLS